MIWGSISVHGTGQLHVLEGTMRSDQYIEVLNGQFFPQLLAWCPDGNGILMHDGAPCHRRAAVTQYLEERGIEVLPWPGNSPDQNPIKGLWKLLKDKINSTPVTTKRELTERIINTWHNDPEISNTGRRYILDMPRRIAALIKAKGGHTKY